MPPSASGQPLDYDAAGIAAEGFLARPAATEDRRLPCVLIAHAWDGPNEPIREIARRIAALGYVALAIDVYGKGMRGDPVGDNTHLMAPLLQDRALLRRRLEAGLAAARALEGVDPDRIAAIGYCFGGLCVLDLARAVPEGLKGVVSFHGVLKPPGLGPQGRIAAKVLVLHGWNDPLAPPDDVLALTREFTDAEADWQLHAYGHALHAFTHKGAKNPAAGVQYDANADRRSWAAMRGFLEEVLAKPA